MELKTSSINYNRDTSFTQVATVLLLLLTPELRDSTATGASVLTLALQLATHAHAPQLAVTLERFGYNTTNIPQHPRRQYKTERNQKRARKLRQKKLKVTLDGNEN